MGEKLLAMGAEEADKDEADRRSAERVKIKQGLDGARYVFGLGQDLPKYLATALIRYEAAVRADVTRRLLLPKLVKRAHLEQKRPLSKTSRCPSAYEEAGNKVGVSMSTAERAYRDYPPARDYPLDPTDPLSNDAAISIERNPVLASKGKKTSKR